MSTNFYVEGPRCRECGHARERYHLGKASCGWKFIFEVRWMDENTLRSWRAWKYFIMEGDYLIRDEEDRVVNLKDFEEMIVAKQNEPRAHQGSSVFRDEEGFVFEEDEFE